MDERGQAAAAKQAVDWSTLAKVGAGVVAVGGVAIHFMGLVGHLAYLRTWGVDQGLFPKPTDWLMTNGAAALVDRTALILAAANTVTGKLVAIAILMFVVLAGWLRFAGRSPRRASNGRGQREGSNSWSESLWLAGMVTFTTIGSVPVAMLFVAMLILFPWVAGDTYGAAAAERERAKFDRGCDAAASSAPRCIDVRKGDQLIVRGFLIESSQSHLAVYDPDAKARRTLTIPRGDTELQSNAPPIATPTSAAPAPASSK
jgi:hypothetical protein